MKRIPALISLILAVVMIATAICLSSCGGNIENVNVVKVESEIYTADEIDSAIKVILDEFDKSWDGCTMKEIYYAGDDYPSYKDWAKRNNADEAIVLISTFETDSGNNLMLEPNSTYSRYNWILVRSDGGEWKHVDHGY